MSRFDLFAGADGTTFILDLQSDFLEHYNTRVVAPVVPAQDYDGAAQGLNPTVMIGESPYIVQTHFLATIPAARLQRQVGTLEAYGDQITRALDMLFQGY
jgi:toxin CcdB